jgi:two-component system, response regulator YesN
LFKLLIIDDEDNTREGIIERLSWDQIGISQIDQADDGVNALKKAEEFRPDIFLTDVRMPRMDGIELSFKLRELYPNCKIIFMSGYADKAYLMSAIQLKAVSYIEKPINLKELTQALKDAVELCLEDQKKKLNEENITSSLPLLKSDYALVLTREIIDHCGFEKRLNTLNLQLPTDGIYLTLLLRFFPDHITFTKDTHYFKARFSETLEKVCFKNGVSNIFAYKDNFNIIIHLYAALREKHLFTNDKLKDICSQVLTVLEGTDKYFVSIGEKVYGIFNTHLSYTSATASLQKAFFKGYNCIIFSDENKDVPFLFDIQLLQDFKITIEKQDRVQAIFFIKKISFDLKRFSNTLVSNIKDFYFKLLLDLNKAAEKLHFTILDDIPEKHHILEYFYMINTLNELEESLIEYINKYYDVIEEKKSNNGAINMVIKYINENYNEESLSIASISNHIYLSPTYLCSLFKEKTDKTLNQYITEVRIEKSKELLLNKNYKISDISTMIGFRDQGYFTKLFRKVTGMTPSKYIAGK